MPESRSRAQVFSMNLNDLGNADVLGTTWMAGWAEYTNSEEGVEGWGRMGVCGVSDTECGNALGSSAATTHPNVHGTDERRQQSHWLFDFLCDGVRF